MNNNGVLEHHGSDYKQDYFTDLIKRKSLEFLDSQSSDKPFLMVLATPAPHAPFTPAPQHQTEFKNVSAPRLPNFNYVENDNELKHWLVRQQPRPLNTTLVEKVDEIFRNRLRTLLSVDEMVDAVMMKLSDKMLLENTLAIYTSDHGYHLGKIRFIMEFNSKLFELLNNFRQLWITAG